MTAGGDGPGVYVPDNPALRDILAEAGGHGFRPDHALLLLHFISAKRWMGDVDEDGFARLSAGILRQWIHPRALGPLKRYLVASGVLRTASYAVGRRSTGYRIADPFYGPPRRYVVEYAPLARKLQAWRTSDKRTRDDPELQATIARRRALLDHLRRSLDSLSLPDDPEAMVEALRGKADAGHVAYVAQCIEHHDHEGLTVDSFGWRVHSLITRTSSHLRPLLLLDSKPVVELDVANSQATLLAIALAYPAGKGSGQSAHNILVGQPCPLPPVLPASEGICTSRQEAGDFLEVCGSGTLYELLAQDAGIERDQAKQEVFRDVLFGKMHFPGHVGRAFKQRWPTLFAAICNMKAQHGYKAVAQVLQRLESFIMLDRIGMRLLREFPNLPLLTVHDSVLLVAGMAGPAKDIMLEEFARWDAKPTIRVKGAP